MLNGKSLDFVSEWKYLGITVVAGTSPNFSVKPALASFYRSVNSVLSVLKKPDESVLMSLLYSNCVPILANGAEVVEYSASDMRTCNTALNDAIRRIFSYHRWESIRQLRQNLGFPNIYEIFGKRSKKFLDGNLTSQNNVIRQSTVQFFLERVDEEE